VPGASAGAAMPTAWVDVVRLLQGADDEVMATWGRWYLADRDPRWVRRNALVVLGNSGQGQHAVVQQVLADYLRHHDPVLRAHAVWAAARLGLHHLMPSSDPHPDVQLEIESV
jgi:epoxyqueuosine reductase